MANDQALDPLADPYHLLSGEILRGTPITRQLGGLNYLRGSGGTEAPIWQVRRPAGASAWATYAGAGFQAVTAAPLLIPILSDQHLTVQVEMEVNVSAGVGATLKATAVTSGVNTILAVGPTARTVVNVGTVTLDAGGDSILLEVLTTGTTIGIYGFKLSILPMADPLPVLDIGGTETMGVGRGAADLSHHAATNRRIRDALQHLYDRPRRLWCWTGLDPVLGTEFMTNHLHAAPMLTELGASQRATVHLNVDNAGGPATSVPILIGDAAFRPGGLVRVDVGAGVDGWVSRDVVIPEQIGLMPWERSWIGVQPGDGPGLSPIPIRAGLAVTTP